MTEEVLVRAKRIMEYFRGPSLIGDLVAELQRSRAETLHWQERALQLDATLKEAHEMAQHLHSELKLQKPRRWFGLLRHA